VTTSITHSQEKDKEATLDMQPLKKLTNKKNKVAPGGGDDDSDLGLEDVLLKDEEQKAGREGTPGAVRVKSKPTTKGAKGVVIGDGNDGLDIGDSPMAVVKQKEASMAKADKSKYCCCLLSSCCACSFCPIIFCF